ncbi:efflux RND transporter permease subunit [Vampirovibrio chlorellavorus]|uniref:efflux RND transporter permease subunit n=1 Tax=Vampirovibrio chlorellavorus TaxID=758823 RepID=UPI0026F07594|nr:efflux RND transporter permease subunit [Vampirovibrio chlorellavorus]
MNNFTKLFIDRPIMTTLVMLGILLFGILAYRQLPVSDLPNVDFPTIQVSASLPGANPDTMAASVATPLEQQFSTIAGLDSMNSTSSLGSTSITLQFNLSRNIDAAAQDVQAAISAALRKLPNDMPSPPSLRKVNPADSPIIYLALTSPILPLSEVDEYAQKVVAQRISMINGVAQVSVFGSQKYAVRVQVDPKALASRNLGIDEVATAIQKGNVNLPTGVLYGDYRNYTVKASGQLMKASDYRPLIVAYRNGSPVYLSELGRVLDSVENNKTASWFNGTRGIVLAVQRQPGTNTIGVIDKVKELFPSFQAIIPPSVKLEVVFDRSQTIRKSVEDVQLTLVITIVLVIAVIFLFLRNIFATLIASLALPMSIVGTFAAMSLLNFNLDNLSLMALTLAVGFVVDDAIVVLENIIRHMEMGKGPLEASVIGSREIAFTVLSMTVSLVAVFIPILFMGGVVGRLFNEFAMTMAVSILISGFISLSLTPMLCSRLLRAQNIHVEQKNGLLVAFEAGFNSLYEIYHDTLKICLRYKKTTMAVFAALLGLTVVMFGVVSKGFIPTEDTNQLFTSTEGPQGIAFPQMVAHQQQLADIIRKNPNVQSVMSSVDNGNTGRIFATLKPLEERKETVTQVIQKLRPQLAEIPGIRAFMQAPPTIRLGGQLSKSLYQFTLQSPDLPALYQSTDTLLEKLKKLDGLQDVTTDLQMTSPQLTVDIDRSKASSLGITAEQIELALSNAYGTRQVSTIYAANNDYQVILELLPEYQQSLEDLSAIYVRSGNGSLVPLNALANLKRSVGPLSVSHLGQFPSTTISFNLRPGVSLGQKVAEIETLARQTLPATVRSSFQGSAQEFQSSLSGMGFLLIIAVLVIYLVLGILYESFIHPITILSGLPPAGLGALLTLYLFNRDLDIYGFLGLILLIGIVKKNAIMMIDFALEAQRKGHKSAAEAIYEACLVRFRPIMMTTLAALMGALPLAIGLGAGSESRRTLGLAVFGGLLVSQLLTLYITPVLYIYLDAFKNRLTGFGRAA